MSDPEDRANVMVYMESFGGAPARPEPVVVEEEVTEDPAGEEAAEETAEGVEAEAAAE